MKINETIYNALYKNEIEIIQEFIEAVQNENKKKIEISRVCN